MDLKTERQGIYRTKEGLLANKNFSELQAYRLKKRQTKRVDEIEADIRELKKDFSEIKQMIQEFLTK